MDLENAVDLQDKKRPRKTNQSGGFGSQARCTLLRSKRGSLSLASAAHSIGARHFKTLETSACSGVSALVSVTAGAGEDGRDAWKTCCSAAPLVD